MKLYEYKDPTCTLSYLHPPEMPLTSESQSIVNGARKLQDYVGGASFSTFTRFSGPPLRQLHHIRTKEIVKCKIIGRVTKGFYFDVYWRLTIEAPDRALYFKLANDYIAATDALDVIEEFSMDPGKEDCCQKAQTRLIQETCENKVLLSFIKVNLHQNGDFLLS